MGVSRTFSFPRTAAETLEVLHLSLSKTSGMLKMPSMVCTTLDLMDAGFPAISLARVHRFVMVAVEAVAVAVAAAVVEGLVRLVAANPV